MVYMQIIDCKQLFTRFEMEETVSTEATKMMQFIPWWLVLIQGIILLIIGGYLLAYPLQTLFVLLIFLGAYWFVSGIFGIISAAMTKQDVGWKIVLGILGIIAGLIILTYPYYSTLLILPLLAILIGVWGLFMGFVYLFRGFGTKDWGAVILGIIGIILGIIILGNTLVTAILLPYIMGAFAIVAGIAAIIGSFMMRK
jgi:uncharacterized membrane protein HdeD (DUF308 family)